MHEQPIHCPFLNRSDPRCSSHFSLDRLNHAFHHCFGDYQACAHYCQILSERQLRRTPAVVLEATTHDHDQNPVIQVTVHPRYKKPLAGAA